MNPTNAAFLVGILLGLGLSGCIAIIVGVIAVARMRIR